MRRLLLTVMFLFLFCFTLSAYPTATLTDQAIAVTPKGIYIQLYKRALGEVLSHIQQQSGIQFTLPHAMRMTRVTATVTAPDWPTAVRELLRPFNTAEVWHEDRTPAHHIFVFEQSQAASLPEEPSASESKDRRSSEATAMPERPSAASLPPLPPPPPPLEVTPQ